MNKKFIERFKVLLPSLKYEKIVVSIFLIIFASAFFIKEQYWVSFLTLILILLLMRITDLYRLVINKSGLELTMNKIESDYIKKTLTSNKILEEKIKNTQKLIDEVFKLGYMTSGSKGINNIQNVQINRDKDGKIISYQYDEN